MACKVYRKRCGAKVLCSDKCKKENYINKRIKLWITKIKFDKK